MQIDVNVEPIKQVVVKVAYKWYDVKSTYDKQLLNKPYVPKHRVMFNVAYSSYMDIWKYDFTVNWLGQTRIPNTFSSPVQYKLPTHSNEYYLLNAQITKKFRKFDTYLGAENILNFTQKNPIVAAENPFGNNFDASMVYAPIEGRIIYVGVRMEIK